MRPEHMLHENEKLSELLYAMNDLDHFELINELAFAMSECSEKVLYIRNSFENIGKVRQELPIELANIYIMFTALRRKFAVCDVEWGKVLPETIDKWMEDYKKEEEAVEDFSSMEF